MASLYPTQKSYEELIDAENAGFQDHPGFKFTSLIINTLKNEIALDAKQLKQARTNIQNLTELEALTLLPYILKRDIPIEQNRSTLLTLFFIKGLLDSKLNDTTSEGIVTTTIDFTKCKSIMSFFAGVEREVADIESDTHGKLFLFLQYLARLIFDPELNTFERSKHCLQIPETTSFEQFITTYATQLKQLFKFNQQHGNKKTNAAFSQLLLNDAISSGYDISLCCHTLANILDINVFMFLKFSMRHDLTRIEFDKNPGYLSIDYWHTNDNESEATAVFSAIGLMPEMKEQAFLILLSAKVIKCNQHARKDKLFSMVLNLRLMPHDKKQYSAFSSKLQNNEWHILMNTIAPSPQLWSRYGQLIIGIIILTLLEHPEKTSILKPEIYATIMASHPETPHLSCLTSLWNPSASSSKSPQEMLMDINKIFEFFNSYICYLSAYKQSQFYDNVTPRVKSLSKGDTIEETIILNTLLPEGTFYQKLKLALQFDMATAFELMYTEWTLSPEYNTEDRKTILELEKLPPKIKQHIDLMETYYIGLLESPDIIQSEITTAIQTQFFILTPELAKAMFKYAIEAQHQDMLNLFLNLFNFPIEILTSTWRDLSEFPDDVCQFLVSNTDTFKAHHFKIDDEIFAKNTLRKIQSRYWHDIKPFTDEDQINKANFISLFNPLKNFEVFCSQLSFRSPILTVLIKAIDNQIKHDDLPPAAIWHNLFMRHIDKCKDNIQKITALYETTEISYLEVMTILINREATWRNLHKVFGPLIQDLYTIRHEEGDLEKLIEIIHDYQSTTRLNIDREINYIKKLIILVQDPAADILTYQKKEAITQRLMNDLEYRNKIKTGFSELSPKTKKHILKKLFSNAALFPYIKEFENSGWPIKQFWKILSAEQRHTYKYHILHQLQNIPTFTPIILTTFFNQHFVPASSFALIFNRINKQPDLTQVSECLSTVFKNMLGLKNDTSCDKAIATVSTAIVKALKKIKSLKAKPDSPHSKTKAIEFALDIKTSELNLKDWLTKIPKIKDRYPKAYKGGGIFWTCETERVLEDLHNAIEQLQSTLPSRVEEATTLLPLATTQADAGAGTCASFRAPG